MAAWVGRIEAVDNDGAGHVNISVTYWAAADTTFTTQLGSTTLSFGAGATLGEVQARIQTEGSTIRFGQTASAALQPRVGTTINIP